ncbi:hypothetical protein KJ359_010987 [Pestalotiopsis sp. 9143b]|nr:hypothetical protein KJ359_010987 [Pestalotiopsis sp. 9143b]
MSVIYDIWLERITTGLQKQHINSVPFFPGEDTKLRASSLAVRRGGNCPNTLEVLQQLLEKQQRHDVAPYLITALPAKDSPGAAKVKESFGSRSIVDLSRCVYREGYAEPASSYIIRSEATDSRTLVSYNDLPDVTVDDFKAAAGGLLRPGGKTWWHFEVSLFWFPPSCTRDMSSIKTVCTNRDDSRRRL